ncbi:potassium-transporting ATPase subunit KdpA [Brevibacterium aurantiacum]|uniref:Potassium-transporting ATPase potassium-binding subunit n=1 Tax=Brevibacterium aurantiacum TaxID=273384 RepID=A0A2A3ZSM8_BREAU|nr:potassium-transporting ATPase subunit KdpA [Brevibacterium aurantiacum]AZL10105.1 potassium-transporting ATPase subunit KdpA [Brevibacterium aurantiacum]PCC54589.1 potassium-transporting ATPase subunit KdpA [Brevibacterium aurantiacum]
MNWFTGITQVLLVFACLAAAYVPLGNYMARVFTSDKDLKVESGIYQLTGIDSNSEQRWRTYFLSVLGFSLVSILLLYGLQRLQAVLPLSNGMAPVAPDQAWNTAVSFVTNTNWQSYSGEATMGFLTQMAGLAVQNFLSAAVGIAVVVALIRGLMHRNSLFIGNFWVDLTRGALRILVPISLIFALIYMGLGVIENLSPNQVVQTVSGGAQATQTIPGGPNASQEVIKHLGTNGGGFFNTNSAHPLSAPSPLINLANIFLILLIPTALTRTFGVMVGSRKHGYAILAAMATFFLLSLAAVIGTEMSANDPAAQAAGGSMEGRETRFGVIVSAFFAVATTLTSTGAVDSFHSSYSGLGGGVLMLNMMLGEIAPGGVGSGLYGMLVVAIVAVFVCGLMVGRTPEFLGKKIGRKEITLASIYILISPTLVLAGTAVATMWPGASNSILNADSPHGLSEILYAFTSASNNNGSAFAGLDVNTPFFNTALGLAMFIGRLAPICAILALAGAFAGQGHTKESAGTLPTHRPLFVGVTVGVGLILSALTFLPVLALGPINEGLL